MFEPIPLCEPYLRMVGTERAYLHACLDASQLAQGPYIEALEDACARRFGKKYAVATSSGTAALHIALLVSGVKPGHRVIVPDLTFVATANVVRYCGAEPVLVDAEPEYWQMDVDLVDTLAPKFALSVDLYGHPSPAFNHRPGVWIQDATESLGALACDAPTTYWPDIACLSFNGNKLITGAGGGMLLTDDSTMAEYARYLINQAKGDSGEFSHGATGFNYRLANINAAIAFAQFESLDWRLDRKRKIAARYAEALADLPGIQLMPKAPWAEPAYWLYSILTPTNSRPLLAALAAENIQSRPFFKPMHLLPMFADCHVLGGDVAVDLWSRGVNLPSSVGLTVEQQDRVIDVIRRSWKAVTA